MPSTTVGRGNLLFDTLIAVQMTPAAVTGLQDSTQTFAVPGVLADGTVPTWS